MTLGYVSTAHQQAHLPDSFTTELVVSVEQKSTILGFPRRLQGFSIKEVLVTEPRVTGRFAR